MILPYGTRQADQHLGASDHVEATLKRKSTIPSLTHWNSHHDAVSRITENMLDELNILYSKLELCCFTEKGF